jgi:hypothetical protein
MDFEAPWMAFKIGRAESSGRTISERDILPPGDMDMDDKDWWCLHPSGSSSKHDTEALKV